MDERVFWDWLPMKELVHRGALLLFAISAANACAFWQTGNLYLGVLTGVALLGAVTCIGAALFWQKAGRGASGYSRKWDTSAVISKSFDTKCQFCGRGVFAELSADCFHGLDDRAESFVPVCFAHIPGVFWGSVDELKIELSTHKSLCEVCGKASILQLTYDFDGKGFYHGGFPVSLCRDHIPPLHYSAAVRWTEEKKARALQHRMRLHGGKAGFCEKCSQEQPVEWHLNLGTI